jgi:hypothetical protein
MADYSTTNAPLPYVQPYLQDYLSRAQGVANQGYQASPTQVADPNAYLQQGWNATANRAVQGSPVMGAANTALTGIINGSSMNANPYLDQSVQAAQGDLVRSWNTVNKPYWDTAMQGSGSYGNTGVAEYAGNASNDLQKNLSNISTTMRGNAYNQGLQQQTAALGMAPTYANQDYTDANALMNVGNQAQGFADRGAQQNYNWWSEAQKFPQQQLDAYGRALGVGTSSGNTETKPGVDPYTSALGGAITGSKLGDSLGLGSGWGAIIGGLLGYGGG